MARIDAFVKILNFLLVFIIGFLAAQFWHSYAPWQKGITGLSVSNPSEFVDERALLVYPNKVVIRVDGAKVSRYDSTGSMAPMLHAGTKGISIAPEYYDEIKVGDIVVFRRAGKLIVHRVIERGYDVDGTYFITQGDRNDFSDGKIRFEEIEGVLIGVIY